MTKSPTTKSKKKRTNKKRSDGRPFERKIVTELREIYDPPDLVSKIAQATKQTRQRYQKLSVVRRGEQGKGAHEPDVCTPSKWWFECQWASDATYNPRGKLGQAVRDLEFYATEEVLLPWTKPCSVCQKKNSQRIEVFLFLNDYIDAINPDLKEMVPTELLNVIINIDFEVFKRLLRYERAREIEQSDPRSSNRGVRNVFSLAAR